MVKNYWVCSTLLLSYPPTVPSLKLWEPVSGAISWPQGRLPRAEKEGSTLGALLDLTLHRALFFGKGEE